MPAITQHERKKSDVISCLYHRKSTRDLEGDIGWPRDGKFPSYDKFLDCRNIIVPCASLGMEWHHTHG